MDSLGLRGHGRNPLIFASIQEVGPIQSNLFYNRKLKFRGLTRGDRVRVKFHQD